MADAFNSIIGVLGQAGGALGKLGGAANPLFSLAGLINQFSLASKEKKALDQSLWYSKHPQAIAALTSQFQKPLNAGLTSGVGNIVNANLASQGLSEAPGIQSQVFAQALAPYYQQNQNTALQEALAAIGLPAQALQSLKGQPGALDIASLLKGILPQGSAQFPTAGGQNTDTGITYPTDPTNPGGGQNADQPA